MRHGPWVAALLLGVLTSTLAAAEHELPKPAWEAGLALGWADFESYPGSANRHALIAGAPWFIYRGRHLRASGRSARVVFLETPTSWIDLSGGGWVPVDSSEEARRQSMPDLDMVVQLGPRAGRMLSRGEHHEALVRVGVRGAWSFAAFNDNAYRGYLAEPQIRLVWRPRGHDGGVQFTSTLSARWADRELNAYYYGVPAAFSTPERPAWEAPAGLQSVGVRLSFGWRLHPRWTVGGFIGGRHLGPGVVGASPLVETPTSITAGVGVNWTFAASTRMVSGRRVNGDRPP